LRRERRVLRRAVVAIGVLAVAVPMAFPRELGAATLHSADDVLRAIAAGGPAQVAAQVSNDAAAIETIAAGVASGRPDWLDVASKLISVAEPYLRERLVAALSYALERDAEAVLERATSLPMEAVCGYDPLTPMSSLPPCKTLYRLLAPRERALEAIEGPHLADVKKTCVAAVARLKARAPKSNCTP
jgi:hypothetical protein